MPLWFKTALDQLQEILRQTARTTVMLDALHMDMLIHRNITEEEEGR